MFTSNTFFSGENAKLYPFRVSVPQEQSTKVNPNSRSEMYPENNVTQICHAWLLSTDLEKISSENTGNPVCR